LNRLENKGLLDPGEDSPFDFSFSLSFAIEEAVGVARDVLLLELLLLLEEGRGG
jgi:hypothetical protein